MENRRLLSLKRDPSLRSSTIISPQLENYSLYMKPLATKALSESYRKKKVEDFGLLVNVGNARPSEIKIVYGKGDVLEIKINQPPTPYNGMTFARECIYKYELPKKVDKSTLKALKTTDNYLIILPLDLLRENWMESALKEPFPPMLSHDRPKKPDHESEEMEAMISEKPDQETKESEISEEVLDEAALQELEKRREESDKKCPPGSELPTIEMDRVIRPCLDVLILRKRLLNIERYVSRIRKFVENSSFIVEDKLTIERFIYDSAKQSQRYYRAE